MPIARLEVDLQRVSRRVPDGVAARLLNHAKRRHFAFGGAARRAQIDAHINLRNRRSDVALDLAPHRAFEPQVFQPMRMQRRGQVARVRQRVVGQGEHRRQRFCVDRRLCRHPLQRDFQDAEDLPHMVVQVARDAPALVFLGSDQAVRQGLELGIDAHQLAVFQAQRGDLGVHRDHADDAAVGAAQRAGARQQFAGMALRRREPAVVSQRLAAAHRRGVLLRDLARQFVRQHVEHGAAAHGGRVAAVQQRVGRVDAQVAALFVAHAQRRGNRVHQLIDETQLFAHRGLLGAQHRQVVNHDLQLHPARDLERDAPHLHRHAGAAAR